MIRGATYDSHPCKRCGGVKRYISNGNCPVCQAESNRRYKARKQGLEPIKPKSPINTKNRSEGRKSALFSMFKRWFYSPLEIFRFCVN